MMKFLSHIPIDQDICNDIIKLSYQKLIEFILAINGIKLVKNKSNEASTNRSSSLQHNLSKDDKVVLVNAYKLENSRLEGSYRKIQDTVVSDRETSMNLTSTSDKMKFSSLLKPSFMESTNISDEYLNIEDVKFIKKKCKGLFWNK